MDDPKTPQQPPPQQQPPQQQPQQQLPPQQLHVFRQFQQQQKAAVMARFPSNIDAHLLPLGSNRPHLIPPNPNPSPTFTTTPPPPPPPPHLLKLKVNSSPQPPSSHPIHPPLDVWRLQSNLKRPFDVPLSDKVADDAVFTVRDRKVRISDRNALYALCRSWLKNGYREESQPHYGDASRSLPKPLHLPESSSPERKEIDDETDGEDESALGTLCAEELLQRHVNRAKRVRERLRAERLRRIERYKSRLKLLLPSPLEQCREDAGPP
ncbi:uncharacterized protein LOC141626477 [Silene latifolia]|uniref:uncharacterized protein LOC141626477 n=1 Tax=Silene latifolia TaxID=37657 RepID=UPI003D78817F